jgi:integrase/recombinase XerD
MGELIESNKDLHIIDWKDQLIKADIVLILQERLDQAEELDQQLFGDFSDVEMLQWFLHRKEHLNRQHDKSPRTIIEYKRGLTLFG